MWSLFLNGIIRTFGSTLYNWKSNQVGKLFFDGFRFDAEEMFPIFSSLLLSDLNFVLSSWKKNCFSLARYHEGDSKYCGYTSKDILPPFIVVEPFNRIGPSTNRIDEIDGECEKEQTNEKLKNRVLDNFYVFLMMSVSDIGQVFETFLAFLRNLSRFSFDKHLNNRKYLFL